MIRHASHSGSVTAISLGVHGAAARRCLIALARVPLLLATGYLRTGSCAVNLAPRCFEWAIGASRLSTGPYRNRSWRLPRGSPRIRFRWSKAGLADALPRAMRLKCKRNVPTAPEVRYLGDLAAQRALAAKGWAFGIASPNSDQRTHLRTQVPYPLGIARSQDMFLAIQ